MYHDHDGSVKRRVRDALAESQEPGGIRPSLTLCDRQYTRSNLFVRPVR